MSFQNGKAIRFLHGSVIISGIISCKTGIFIGGADEALQIGGIDKNVVRNPLTGEPYIPGSSLKGKLRSITEKIVKDAQGNPLIAGRTGGDKGRKVWRHECDDYKSAKDCKLCRIFGSTGSRSGNDNFPGALLVRDGILSNSDELMQDGLHVTEIKMENAIDRLTSAAHPRTFERVPAGAEFKFELVYRVETLEPDTDNMNGNVRVDSERVKSDLTNLLNAMEILEKDGLGGNISRGYGSVEFKVNTFQGYDTKNNKKGGFSEDGAKSLSSVKGKISDITFTK